MGTKLFRRVAALVFCAVVMTGCIKSTLNGLSSADFVWVTTQGDQKVTAFSLNTTSGSASQVGSAVSTGVGPVAMAITGDGKTLFVANNGDATISVYSVNSDGSLKSQGTTPSQGQNPTGLAVDPTSKLLFITNQGIFSSKASGTVAVFAISSGTLTAKTTFSTAMPSNATGTGPTAAVVSPVGFPCKPNASQTSATCYALYVSNQFTSTISAYDYLLDASGNFVLGSVDLNGNFITGGTVRNSPYPSQQNPSSLAFSRCAGITTATANCSAADGNNLFVADSGSNDLNVFSACIQASAACSSPDGSLTPVTNAPFAAGIGPVSVIVDPAADFVYAVDVKSNQLSQFKYSPATGGLSALSPATVSTSINNANPVSGGITHDGNFLIVPNNGGSNLFVLKVTLPGGTLAPAVTESVPLAGQPSAVIAR
ncbi:MAG: beta-propeller fold lactonase family protein [Acidobacteria bacterium]|nr:beta-propeller fold lactonase family protein [Acidobacteriota bacterium]